jgi:hypothetical protein
VRGRSALVAPSGKRSEPESFFFRCAAASFPGFAPLSGPVTSRVQDYGIDLPFTAAFRVAPALNVGILEAPICISSPVLGFRPLYAGRSRTSKLPKPGNDSESPFFSVSEMPSSSAPTVTSMSALLQPSLLPWFG